MPILRVTTDFVVDKNDPQAMGDAEAMARDGDFGRYFKRRTNRSSTELETLSKVRVKFLK